MRSLDEVAALVPFLRARQDDPQAGDLVARELIADPDHLAAVVAATGEGRGSDDPQVLASLWWQAYAYRTAGTALAAWVAAEAGPDIAAVAGSGVGVGRSRPASLVVGAGAAELVDLPVIVERAFADHLEPLAESLRARHQIGTRLLWGNAAAAIASCLGAVLGAAGAPAELAHRADRVGAALPHGMSKLGTWVAPYRAYRRTTCCLWWKTTAADGALCEDCSLR
jgi:ferric iron reductase protein FhuF